MREQERSQRPDRPGLDENLAGRLDALSPIEAERVLERAIRMQSQRHHSDQFTPAQIRRIASELGVSGSVVDRASVKRWRHRRLPRQVQRGWSRPALSTG